MGMLIAAGLFFIGIHIFISSTPLRGWLIARLGTLPYQGAFSLLSFAGIAWLIWAYARMERTQSWALPEFASLLAMLVAFIGLALAMLGVLSPNPTTVNQEALLQSPAPASGLIRITRHPFMVGAVLWALAHMALNPDAASLVFFGVFLILAGLGPWLIDRKKARAFAGQWPQFAAVTSIVPFAAILDGRNQFKPGEIGLWRPAVAVLIVLSLMYFHGALFGVALF